MKNFTFFLLACLFCFFLCSLRHIGPKYDTAPRDALDKTALKIAKKYHLKLLNSGLTQLTGYEGGLWGLNFISNDKITFEQARPMAADIARIVLYKMYNDPLFKKYLSDAEQYSRNPKILQNKEMAFKIAFWDENVDRPLFPYLAQIRFADSKMYYFYANPQTQALEEPIIECLEDLGVEPDQYH